MPGTTARIVENDDVLSGVLAKVATENACDPQDTKPCYQEFVPTDVMPLAFAAIRDSII